MKEFKKVRYRVPVFQIRNFFFRIWILPASKSLRILIRIRLSGRIGSCSGSYLYLVLDPFKIQQLLKFLKLLVISNLEIYKIKLVFDSNKTYYVEYDVFFTAFFVQEA